MKIYEVVEQIVFFDGDPRFMDTSAVINLLNHHGFCAEDTDYCRTEGGNPRRYKVRMTVEAEEIPDTKVGEE